MLEVIAFCQILAQGIISMKVTYNFFLVYMARLRHWSKGLMPRGQPAVNCLNYCQFYKWCALMENQVLVFGVLNKTPTHLHFENVWNVSLSLSWMITN